ncbi:N-6 DNA methylase [Micromonospora robiginosa]|uniref:N-6 DNA methylase n=1 Tax=Micromonospora robiginosa TaxID=2749844 RepID=A0A7L6BBL2_9ACTN|nr:N-6 DNA methylase [Micromonospora ferruginea]QLQ39352.1 N-6 DNA methylase [Micromonospora ferruginea]
MTTSPVDLLSRAEIARLAGVERPAVTNWQRRHNDFPKPLVTAEGEFFRREEVIAWLAGRRIPGKGRRPDEAPGTTYAARLASMTGKGVSERVVADEPAWHGSAEDVVWRLHDLSRASPRDGGFWHVLLALIFVRRNRPELWPDVLEMPDVSARLSRSFEAAGLPEAARAVQHFADIVTDAHHTLRGMAGLAELAGVTSPGPGASPDGVVTLFDYAFDRLAEEVRHAFVTPRSLARLIAEMVGPLTGDEWCFDPFCRGGELLVELLRSAGKPPTLPSRIDGAHPSSLMVELARMNISMHVSDRTVLGEVRQGEVTLRKAVDVVVANPPFGVLPRDSAVPGGPAPIRRKETVLLQSAISSLAEGGRGALVLPNVVAFGKGVSDRATRRALVEAGAITAVVALPPGLFAETAIGVTLWLVQKPAGKPVDVLFVDARSVGEVNSRGRRTLRPGEIRTLVGEVHRWRSDVRIGRTFAPSEGLSAAVSPSTIAARDYSLLPSAYIEAESSPPEAVHGGELSSLRDDLTRLVERANVVDVRVHELLRGLEDV